MELAHPLWRAIRWPLVVLTVGVVGVVAATILDAAGSEWSLTIGAPSLVFLLPIGAVWLVFAVIGYFVGKRRAT
jgi:hypothetical protein